ncbi:hypothetical protein RFI_36554 [Reticulomyxa filosa]|uniref:Uncharacterized protein n=1 Tax=Reticulomyxa filosa TaxID=46433 RepID=X6LHS7_RETFI|nr:hypothetical protein RFI_36554 [Reticulomyxa filosa]|eukprot:ETO00886.1 hypothetical protein RFI_36554 [Reticulomyxa filosa]
MIHYFFLSNDFSVEQKKFSLFFRKNSLGHYNRAFGSSLKQPSKANFYNMELALESSFTSVFLCKVQQLPKKKENNQCKPNTPKTITSFKRRALSSRLKQIRLSILISPDIGNIQIDIVHLSLQSSEDTNFFCCFIQSLEMIKFGMKSKSSSFSELSSMGKMFNTKYEKKEEKPQVNMYTINPMIFGMYIFSGTKKKATCYHFNKIILSEHSRGGDQIDKYKFYFLFVCVDDEKVVAKGRETTYTITCKKTHIFF